MRKIDKILYIAIIPPFLISLGVLTFVVFSDKLGRLSELLITRNASPEVVLVIAGTLAPAVLMLTLPLSFLIGTLIGLSGLSGECQITALRACGVSMRQMLRPVFTLAVIVGLATSVLSVVVLPKTNDIYNGLLNLINVRQVTSRIVPRVFNDDFANIVFYLDDLSIDRQHWDRVFLADNTDKTAPRIVLAREGTWISDPSGSRLQLHLENGAIYEVNPQDPSKDKISQFGATDIPIELNITPLKGTGSGALQDPSEKKTADLIRVAPGLTPEQRRDELIELHQRFALPCSVLAFALIGLALGINTRGGGRTSGSVLSLILVLLFYVLFFNGRRLAAAGQLSPWLGLWGADIILVGVGLFLLACTERCGGFSHSLFSWHWQPWMETLTRKFHMGPLHRLFRKINDLAFSSTSRIVRLRFPKVLDVYIGRGFLVYFVWSTVVCYSLFVILTLFDLLDDIIKNHAGILLILQYFVFLTPQILLYIVPMAVLVAILIQFGILEKGSEVTALKAGGWSLYRIALPVFLTAGFLCAGIFFIQDFILPYANVRQDAMRNLIKGKPPQNFRRMRKWIFGESRPLANRNEEPDRIFNYDLFNSNTDTFYGLNVYEVDLRQLTIKRRVYANNATIDSQGKWQLDNGWIRDFRPEHKGFERIAKRDFSFPEQAAYFRKEIFEPKESSKLTYLELKAYIEYLKQSGYNAIELQVELNKKVSFPLSCFVMALLGIPFSFSMGKKGAFFGITASVIIAMAYWGIFSVFEQMGAYGLLTPLLSAWAPNLLFGAAGLALLFTIRT